MSDPFQASLEASECEVGPFRTADPTTERRLERAREASFERVFEKTRAAIADERHRERKTQRILLGLLGLAAAILGVVVVMVATGARGWFALVCPAVSAFVTSALVAWKHRALSEAGARRRFDDR